MARYFGSVWFIAPLLVGMIAGSIADSLTVACAVFGVLLLPAIIAMYIPYAKDNPEHVWFKRKLYGWGWTPVTWQGWLVIAAYVGILATLGLTLDERSPVREVMFMFVLPSILLTIALIRICFKKGEAPRWQWGEDTGQN